MNHLADITTTLAPFLAKTDALQRFNALRGVHSPSAQSNQGWQWIVMTALFLVLMGFILFPLLAYFRRRFVVLLGVLWSAMATSSSREKNVGGLSASDVELITRMIRQSGFVRAGLEFTLPYAINVGTANYLNSDEYSELSGEQRWDMEEKIEVLKKKLGAESSDDDGKDMTTRRIPVGAEILVSHTGIQDDFELVVQDNSDEGLRVHPPFPVRRPAERSWILRYFDGVRVWGFTTPVSQKNGDLILEHTGEMEMVNYRRFARVPVELSARVGRFLFHSSGGEKTTLELIPANVVEIGGPGVMFRTVLKFRIGERVILLLDFGKNEIIQAVSRIRRVNDPNPRTNLYSYGAELVGLKPSQIAELMQMTNSAAIVHRKEEQEKEEERKKEEEERKKQESQKPAESINTVATA